MTECFYKYPNVKLKWRNNLYNRFSPFLYSGRCNPFLRKSENTTFIEWCIITSQTNNFMCVLTYPFPMQSLKTKGKQ